MSEAERLHRHLVGQQGSRRSLNTPALVLDLEMLDRNIAEMAAFAKAHGMKLRPHSKTHKSADIARGVQAVTTFVEERVREHPVDWFWVHKRWPDAVYAALESSRF